jgi:acetoin:2,6-dichlorophenolindophenol oxidoreductase subunit beta
MRRLRYLQALNEALHAEFARDPSVLLLGEDVRGNMRGEARGLYQKFGGERVRDCPISEAAFTGFATGAAMAGLRPVVEYQIPSLVYIAFDQLVNQAAKIRFMTGGQTKVPVTYLVMATGAKGNTAGQHSDNPYAYLVQAGMKVIIPSSPADMRGLAVAAIQDDDPVAIICPAALLGMRGDVDDDPEPIDLGVGETKREGEDVTVIAVGHLVGVALAVADEMASRGISLHVWDPRTLLPLDRDGALSAVRKTGRVVILDDSGPMCGYGSELSAFIAEYAFDSLRSPIRRISRAHVPTPFSAPLETATSATADKLAAVVDELVSQTTIMKERTRARM